jgi:hypothetical protein
MASPYLISKAANAARGFILDEARPGSDGAVSANDDVLRNLAAVAILQVTWATVALRGFSVRRTVGITNAKLCKEDAKVVTAKSCSEVRH